MHRRYDMALGHNAFYADQIDRYLADAARLLHRRLPHGHRRRRGRQLDRLHFARLAAETYAYLNCAHPFREGNGRTAKTLLQLAAAEVGYRLNFEIVSKAQWDTASRLSAPEHGRYRPAAERLYPVFMSITAPRG
ncbi:Fic family protein [Tsukamurella soli]|uniref:Fic family protein n=1 Tax=Tsukamurella soli TaxID=644556 RepID=UPI003607ECE8